MKRTQQLTNAGKKMSLLLLLSVSAAALVGCGSGSSAESSERGAGATEATVVESVEVSDVSEVKTSEKGAQTDQPPEVRSEKASGVSEAALEEDAARADAAAPDIMVDMTYAEARSRLMQQGWEPIASPEPGPYGAERALYDAGFIEVSACSGSGAGACSFSYYHPDRSFADGNNGLSITTYGGSRPTIADWDVYALDTDTIADTYNEALADSGGNASGEALQQLTLIPEHFRGEWRASLDECSAPFDETLLEIEPERLVFYESVGPAISIISKGYSRVTVTTELSSEGETSSLTYIFELSDDGSTLNELNYGSVRYRCA